jgi:hypothetical protein
MAHIRQSKTKAADHLPTSDIFKHYFLSSKPIALGNYSDCLDSIYFKFINYPIIFKIRNDVHLINLLVGVFWTSSGYLLKPLMESNSLWRGFMSLMELGLLTSTALVVL